MEQNQKQAPNPAVIQQQEAYTQPILKIIINRRQFDLPSDISNSGAGGEKLKNIKLVFIGQVPDATNRTLRKLELGQPLAKQEETELNNQFPYFKTKVGTLNPDEYHVHFINQTIPNNANTEQLELFVLDLLYALGYVKTLAQIRRGIILYGFPRVLPYNYIYDVLEYLYQDTSILLTGEQICQQLVNKLMIPTTPNPKTTGVQESKVDNLLKQLKLSAKIAYSALELSNNADFQKLIRQIPVIFAPRRFKKTTYKNQYTSNDIYSFEGLQIFTDCISTPLVEQIDHIKTVAKYSMPDLSEYTQIDNSALDDIINFTGLTINNTIFGYLGTDIYDWFESLTQADVKSNNFKLFIQIFHQRATKFGSLDDFNVATLNNRRNFRIACTQNVWSQDSIDIFDKTDKWQNLSNTIRASLCTQPVMDITEIKCKNFIFDCYDMCIETHINIKSLFQDIETNYYLPLVKYVSDRETQLYNIYKPFFRNLDERILNIYLRGKDQIMLFNEEIAATSGKTYMRKLKQLINFDYIVFKWRVDDDNLVNIYLFENGYIITEYQACNLTESGQYINQDRVLGYIKLLTKIVSKIKDKYKLTELSLPNPEKILKNTQANIEYSHLINIGFKYEFELNSKFLWAWTKLFSDPRIANKYDKIDDWQRANGKRVAFDEIINNGFIKKLNTALSNQSNLFVRYKHEDEISFIYTASYGFYSRDNIKYFMRKYLKDHGDRVSNAEKEKMFKLVEKIFKITPQKCQLIFEDIQSIELQTKYSFLYTVIECKIKLDVHNQKIALMIDNVSQYNNNAVIISQINTIIKDIILGSRQIITLDILSENTSILELTPQYIINNRIQLEQNKDQPNKKKQNKQPKNKNISDKTRNTIDNLLELDQDVNFDLGVDINIGGLDIGIDLGGLEIDLDMDAIEKLILIESERENNRKEPNERDKDLKNKDKKEVGVDKKDVGADKIGVQDEGLQDIKLKQFVNSKGKRTVAAYMQEMRKLYDPELFEPIVKGKPSDYNYEHHSCPDTPKRQPFIIAKDKLKEIDPESITGYMRYNNNYYICPRIWDASAGKPISVRQFIESGLKSPYTGGLPILQSPQKNEITDKYSVIIRKPTTGTTWSDPKKHQDWPEILRKTEKDAYPGLTHSAKHPHKVCVPCCFINKPNDLDTNKNEIKQILKVSGAATCQYHGEPESSPGAGDFPTDDILKLGKGDESVESYCKNTEYIGSAGTTLKNCRLGLLPEELNILLNNSQELFMKQNDKAIENNANFFLRRGINQNYITNILDTFSAIFEMKIERLLNIIYNKLTPIDFIELNNGELIDIFCATSDFPIDAKDREKFIKFLTLYPSICEYLNIDVRDVLGFIDNRDINIDTIGKEYNSNNHLIIVNTRLIYKIYSAYYNYLSYLVSPNEIKNYQYVIQIFSKPRKWLIKQGANILIFDKNTSHIKCIDNFNYKTDRLIILIEELPNYFVPVFHIQSKYNQLQPPNGIIKLDETLNLSDTLANALIKRMPTQKKLIDASKDRLSSIIRLLYIQSGLCNYNLTYYHNKLIRMIKTTKLGLVKQYTGVGDNSQAQYLLIGFNDKTNVFIPIYPHFFENKTSINDFYGLAMDMHKHKFNLTKLANNLYPITNNKNTPGNYEPYELMIILNLGYHISEIIIESENSLGKQKKILVTGVRFANELELPLLPQEFNESEIKDIITRIKHIRNDGFTASIVSKPIINLLKLMSTPMELSQVSFNINALLNLLIHQTKNNLSYYISGQQHLKNTNVIQLINIIYNTNETGRDEHLYYSLLDDILQQIIKVDKQTVNEYIFNYFTERKTGKSKLLDKSYTKKVVNLICKKTVKSGDTNVKDPVNSLCIRDLVNGLYKSRIRMPTEIYEYILMAVGKDLIINKIEADTIIKGRYIIPIDDLISSKVSNTIYNQNVDYKQNLIISPTEMSYYVAHNLISKYRRNFKLANPSASVEFSKELNISNKDLDVLSKIVIKDAKNKLVSGLSSIFSSISSTALSSEVSNTTNIKTTVFNSEGILNPNATHSQCVFPYKSSGRLNYHCGTAKDVLNGNKRKIEQQGLQETDLICPTEINNDKNVVSWGYCPTTPLIATTRMGNPNQIVDAYKYINKNVLKKIGNCNFPFIYANRKIVNPLSRAKPFISVNYKCASKGDSAPVQNGTWCYTTNSQIELNNGKAATAKLESSSNSGDSSDNGGLGDTSLGIADNKSIDGQNEITTSKYADKITLLIGAKRGETIYKGNWTLGNLVNNDTGLPELKKFAEKWEATSGSNPAICEVAQDDTKREKVEKGLGLADIEPITRDAYNPDFCKAGASKKGYDKKQLYLFGRDELGINYQSMLNENNKILAKDELCELINNKLRDIKKADILAAAGTLDPEKLKELRQGIYTKDPALCMKGPTKGGYKLTELRDMAITYFGLSQAEADKIDKKQGFCDHITKALGLAIKFNQIDGSDINSDDGLMNANTEIYPSDRNIELCTRSISRGGISSNDLKNILRNKLGIDITGKSKEDMCKLVKEKMIEIANTPTDDEPRNSATAELRTARVDEAIKSEKETGLIGELPLADVDKLNL